MGIYDREYYRDKTRGSGWLSGAAPACKAIILINVAVFVAQKFLGRPVRTPFAADSDDIFHKFQVWGLLTATFLHDQARWHILMNMLFLWMVGREMESFYGTRDFVALYLSAAVISTLCLGRRRSPSARMPAASMIGASGRGDGGGRSSTPCTTRVARSFVRLPGRDVAAPGDLLG